MATYPDLGAVRAYVHVPATALPDIDLQRMMDAAEADQRARCLVPDTEPLPANLEQGFLRRVQKEIAAKNLPLGMVGVEASEYGPTSVPAYDSLVEEHERAHRRVVVG